MDSFQVIKSCATLRLKWLERLLAESLLLLCVAGALRLLRCCSSMRLVHGLTMVDGIRGEYTDTRIGSFYSLFLTARSNRFRTFGERVWAWRFRHFDDSYRHL